MSLLTILIMHSFITCLKVLVCKIVGKQTNFRHKAVEHGEGENKERNQVAKLICTPKRRNKASKGSRTYWSIDWQITRHTKLYWNVCSRNWKKTMKRRWERTSKQGLHNRFGRVGTYGTGVQSPSTHTHTHTHTHIYQEKGATQKSLENRHERQSSKLSRWKKYDKKFE